MIRVVASHAGQSTPVPSGRLTTILTGAEHGTRVEVAVADVAPGMTWRFADSDRTQVIHVLEGEGASAELTTKAATHAATARCGTGFYLEPFESAAVTTSNGPVRLLLVSVPKHVAPAMESGRPVGYAFDESQLGSLVDEKGFRERTFWVNTETGLSGSRDLQLGRMRYAPRAHSPRHVHHPSAEGSVVPEHFYLIQKGTGEVRHDSGTLAVEPGSLILIPAGEWHQLVASDTGLDYIEFQAPFDFRTVMDDDPLGKNWYIKGTDDGTGRPKRWVQS